MSVAVMLKNPRHGKGGAKCAVREFSGKDAKEHGLRRCSGSFEVDYHRTLVDRPGNVSGLQSIGD